MSSGPKKSPSWEKWEQDHPANQDRKQPELPEAEEDEPYNGLRRFASILRVASIGLFALGAVALGSAVFKNEPSGASSAIYLVTLGTGAAITSAILGWLVGCGRDIRRIREALESQEPVEPPAPQSARR